MSCVQCSIADEFGLSITMQLKTAVANCARRLRSLARRQLLQSVTRDARYPPIGQHRGTDRLVETDRRRIPIEHRPFEPPATSRAREARKVDEQSPAITPSSKRRAYEQVFQIQPLATEKRREIMEKQGKCNRLRAFPSHDYFGRRIRAEQRVVQRRLRRNA